MTRRGDACGLPAGRLKLAKLDGIAGGCEDDGNGLGRRHRRPGEVRCRPVMAATLRVRRSAAIPGTPVELTCRPAIIGGGVSAPDEAHFAQAAAHCGNAMGPFSRDRRHRLLRACRGGHATTAPPPP